MDTTTATAKFRRHVNAGTTSMNGPRGRNSRATEECVENHAKAAERILRDACADEANGLPEYLDSPRGAKLAERWAALERYAAGMPAAA